MSEPTQSALDVMNSLTGFEEIAIEQHMDIDPYLDGDAKPMKVMRALVFVLQVREGLTPQKAKDHALGLPLSELQTQFLSEEESELGEEAPKEENS